MVQTDNFSKEEVEYFEWKDCLPESDEMEAERDAAEDSVPFYASDDSPCSWLPGARLSLSQTSLLHPIC
jgi:hypothetical protein